MFCVKLKYKLKPRPIKMQQMQKVKIIVQNKQTKQKTAHSLKPDELFFFRAGLFVTDTVNRLLSVLYENKSSKTLGYAHTHTHTVTKPDDASPSALRLVFLWNFYDTSVFRRGRGHFPFPSLPFCFPRMAIICPVMSCWRNTKAQNTFSVRNVPFEV